MKNGFTLIELLVTIAIICLLLFIVIPVLDTVRSNSSEKAFIASVELVINAAENYINDGENNYALPASGDGKLITVTTLKTETLLTNTKNVETGAVVVYNNAGSYDIYAFISNGKFEVNGYRADDLEAEVTTTPSLTDYATLLASVTDYTLNGGTGQLEHN